MRCSRKTGEGRQAPHLTSEKWRSSWTNSLSFAVSSFFLAAAAVLLVGFSSAALREWSIEVLSRRAARAFAAESDGLLTAPARLPKSEDIPVIVCVLGRGLE